MENIILQKVAELARNIVKKSMEGEIFDIDLLTSDILDECCKLSIEIVEVIVEKMNLQLRNEKAFRKETGMVIKMKDRPRTICTKLGQLTIKRDYYCEKESGSFVYPIDNAIGIEKYERVSGMTKAELVTAATMDSYSRSADIVSKGTLSKQTVRNAILSVKDLNCHSPDGEQKREVPELHIYADEDHVHMQKKNKQKGKECQYVPLVTVTEGTEQVGRNRRKTICPKRFADESFSAKKIWNDVEGYIVSRYDTESIKKIYIHGDGGNWIRNGLERFPNVVHVMDEFHFERALKTVSRKYPESNVRVRIHEAIEENDIEGVQRIIGELQHKTEDKKGIEELRNFWRYIFNNWEAIANRRTRNIPGSCTEGQVSHILSERFSRSPMGWSREGLGKLSCARVHVFNGEKITRENFGFKSEKKESYAEYMQKALKEYLEGSFDWSIFEKERPIFDGNSGTMRMLHPYGIR